MIGTTLANYRIEEKLGEGGMGVVYKATDLNLDRLVAIKVLSANLTDDPGLLERFRAEAKAQAHLNHANIASLYNLLTVDGKTCIVMEYLEGETLDQILRRRGLIPSEEAVPLFRQALLGIGFAHRMGIIHRDIKPSNIMINKYGVAKVMDFGIAKVLGGQRLTRTGTQVGTVAYMSPEQIRNRAVDIRSDIYCLGVTLYELLTAHLPFESDSEFQIMSDHVSTPPPPPTRHYPYIPRGIEQCVMKALEKDPNARFQTVEEFGAALEHPGGIDEWLAQHTPPAAPAVVHTGGTAPPASVSPFAATVIGSTPAPTTIGATPPPGTATPTGDVAAGLVRSSAPNNAPNNQKLGMILGLAALLLIAMAVGGYELFKPKPVIRTSTDTAASKTSVPLSGAVTPSTTTQAPPETTTSAQTDTASQIDTSALGKSSEPGTKATDTGDSSRRVPVKSTETATRARNTGPKEQPARQTAVRATQASSTETAQIQPPPPPPPMVQQPAQTQPLPRPTNPQAAAQQQLRNGAAVFLVQHRHIEFNDRFNSMRSFCSGTLTILPTGIIKYDCIQTQDRRCDHVTFSAADIKQVKVTRQGGIHIATRKMGNWDFYGSDAQVQGALAALTQVVEQAR